MAQAQTPSGHFHAVRFYEDDNSLCRIVSNFIAEGIAAKQPALVIATAPHIKGVLRNLSGAAIDVDALRRSGDLLVLDARETLSQFMVNGQPNAELFNASSTAAIEQVCRGRKDCTIRVYGEMVDLLWKDGTSVAAIRLEILWNCLANSHDFSLLCGYAMGNFYKDAAIEDICRHHTHVVSATGDVAAVA